MSARIRMATSAQDIEQGRELMRTYARWTEVNLCFQNFEGELAELSGKYSAPSGALWVAHTEQTAIPVGVVAVRPLDGSAGDSASAGDAVSACELKRLWVEPQAKGTGLGRALAETAITFARNAGYTETKLDTLRTRMPAAIALYRSLGFVDAEPYTHNPEPDVLYMTLKLS